MHVAWNELGQSRHRFYMSKNSEKMVEYDETTNDQMKGNFKEKERKVNFHSSQIMYPFSP